MTNQTDDAIREFVSKSYADRVRPVLETAHDDQKPRPVAVLVDVSQSMGNDDPRPDRADQWRAAIALGLADPPARGVIPEGSAPQYQPADRGTLADPAAVADAIAYLLGLPPEVEIKELVVTAAEEPSWP